MTSQFKIRFADKADVPLILQFIKELADYEKLLHEVVATEEVLMDSLFVKKSAEVIIGEENGVAVGFALFFHNFSTFLGKSGLYLEDLYVKPEYRGKNYGKKLLQALAGIAQERNCERLDWWCLGWNAPSIEFYKSLGAVPMSDFTVYRMTKPVIAEFAKGLDEKVRG
jgi:GNAT superfamily N-acetyltransferase